MRWFGFGFNVFGQICVQEKAESSRNAVKEVKVITPTELSSHVDRSGCCCRRGSVCRIRASWSSRASLNGFATFISSEIRGCTDAFISESLLTLAFPDRVESWDLHKKEETPAWTMEIKTQSGSSDAKLPLVPGGYVALKPPIYHSLSPHLKAKSLALGPEHAVLLTATGAVYTWGMGSHGQLGHGDLTSQEEPRALEALWGMPMSSVAAGGWHSVCISDGGDLYVWGWNERGQLGLPSRGLRNTAKRKSSQQAGEPCQKASTSSYEGLQEEQKHEEVFISIQAFPALLDVAPSCEIQTVSCGSRHTAAVTTEGDLYTWGWGDYGQLGHQTLASLDEPQRVEFFKTEQLRVVDVVCGAWNTFAAVMKEEVACT